MGECMPDASIRGFHILSDLSVYVHSEGLGRGFRIIGWGGVGFGARVR